jgi:biopolymer transport protein ExbB/TolQ
MPLSNRAVILATVRAAERAAAEIHLDMRRGVNSLATIASVAPWLGLLITVIGIAGSFRVCGGPRSFCMGIVADGLSDALARAALGLLVGIFALWCYRYLSGQLEQLDVEMRSITLELARVVSTN